MRTPEQGKGDFVQQWLNRARKDLAACEVLLKGSLEDYENVGFHAQQSAEKFIKAFLVRHQIEFPKTHDITVLRQLVSRVDSELANGLATADALTPTQLNFAIRETFLRYHATKAKGHVWLSKRAMSLLVPLNPISMRAGPVVEQKVTR